MDVVKTEAARIQELSLTPKDDARASPKRKLQAAQAPDELALDGGDIPQERKRGKRALSSGLLRRDGALVEVQGLLIVAEQVDRAPESGPPVFRTLGSIQCVLVCKGGGLFLETVSSDSHHTIVLDVDAMELVHEPLQRDRKFQLSYTTTGMSSRGGKLRASSYVFMASTKEQYSAWVNGILARKATSAERHQEAAADEKETGAEAGLRDEHKQQTQPSIGEFVFASPPRTKHFILIRHGHYINAHVPQVADSEQVLSQMGRQQAGLAGKYLGNILSRIPSRHYVSICHSDMTRAVETAAIIGNNVGEVTLNASQLLREGWPGIPYSTEFPVGGEAAARTNNAFSAAMQERGRLDSERMEKAFKKFFCSVGEAQEENEDESYCVLVCHANLIRFFLCRALGVDPTSTWGHFEINHCGVTRIDVCINRPIKVVAVNETGHLPQSLLTSSEDHL